MAVARDEVVVDKPCSLHQGVAHRRSYKAEMVHLEIAGHLFGEWRNCWHIAHLLSLWLERDAVNISPKEGIDAPVTLLQFKEC